MMTRLLSTKAVDQTAGVCATNLFRTGTSLKKTIIAFEIIFPDQNMKIIGGEEVDSPNAYPYQVFIEKIWNNTAFFKCGGTIYNERYIITAGHCTYFKDAGVFATPKQMWVTAGTIDLASTDSDIRRDKQVVGVSEIHTHPQFEFKQYENDRSETPIYDIALLKLKKPLKLTDRVAPLQIPPDGLAVKGSPCL